MPPYDASELTAGADPERRSSRGTTTDKEAHMHQPFLTHTRARAHTHTHARMHTFCINSQSAVLDSSIKIQRCPMLSLVMFIDSILVMTEKVRSCLDRNLSMIVHRYQVT